MLPVAVSLLLVAALWWQVDTDAILAAMRAAKPLWLIAGVLAVVPLTLGSAVRFQWLCRAAIGTALAGRLILAACTLNLFLPSKMGDLAKAWVLERRHGFERKFALSLVIFEKLLDLLALLAVGAVTLIAMGPRDPVFLSGAGLVAAGLLLLCVVLSPLAARFPVPNLLRPFAGEWHGLIRWFWSRPSRALGTIGFSVLLWAGHLAQFWLFAHALGPVPLVPAMGAATLSILVGLLPFTMAGIGTRDLAIVFFFQQWLSPAQCAALGLLATLRYLLPAIAGLPFVSDYWRRPEEPR
jgi:uncharacterized membrane protein YbhN (UPF0104 family)